MYCSVLYMLLHVWLKKTKMLWSFLSVKMHKILHLEQSGHKLEFRVDGEIHEGFLSVKMHKILHLAIRHYLLREIKNDFLVIHNTIKLWCSVLTLPLRDLEASVTFKVESFPIVACKIKVDCQRGGRKRSIGSKRHRKKECGLYMLICICSLGSLDSQVVV